MDNVRDGVLYASTRHRIIDVAMQLNIDPGEYILLWLDEEEGAWRKKLKGAEINANKVIGINIKTLEEYGAIIKTPVKRFTRNEMIIILARRWKNMETGITDIIGDLRDCKCTSEMLNIFRADLDAAIEEITMELQENQ